MIVSSVHPKVKELAQKLAPGRKIRSITIHMDASGVVVATVGVLVEDGDLDLIKDAADLVDEPRIVEIR